MAFSKCFFFGKYAKTALIARALGAIGENRKGLGNTNIQEIILKKLYPKAS